MKEKSNFNLVSAAISLLALIFIFAFNFVSVSPEIGDEIGLSAWNLLVGKDEFYGIGVGFFVLLVLIVLIANIVIQFVEIEQLANFAKKYSNAPLNVLSNNIAAIASAAMLLIVCFAAPAGIRNLFGGLSVFINVGTTFGAWLMVILCAAMFFLPKFVDEKLKQK